MVMRKSTLAGAPARAASRMMYAEATAPRTSPSPGISPTIGSMPKRILVPGTRIASSSRTATVCTRRSESLGGMASRGAMARGAQRSFASLGMTHDRLIPQRYRLRRLHRETRSSGQHRVFAPLAERDCRARDGTKACAQQDLVFVRPTQHGSQHGACRRTDRCVLQRLARRRAALLLEIGRGDV